MGVVPDVMHAPTALDRDDRHVLARLNVAHHLEERNDLRPNLVAAGRHDPFLELGTRDARNAAVVFNPQQYAAAHQVRESHQFLDECPVVDVVAFELQP